MNESRNLSGEEERDLTQYYILNSINYVLCAVILIGNSLNIIVYLRYEFLSTTSNRFLTSLSFSDLFSSVSQIIDTVDLGENAIFIEDLAECFARFSFLSSLMHLLLISINRYIAVNDPLRYQDKMTSKVSKAMIAFTWIAMALLTISPMLTFAVKPVQGESMLNEAYGISLMLICYALTMPTVAIVYGKIMMIVRRQQRAISNAIQGPTNDNCEEGRLWKKHRPIVILTMLILCTFVCWTPFVCLQSYVWVVGNDEEMDVFSIIFGILLFANAGVNLFIYVLVSKAYRLAYLNLFRCK